MDSYLELKNLSVGYGKYVVLSNVNISIKKGEVIAMIGPNGAGKSTLLKTISGELEDLGGEILFDGKNLKEYSYSELSRKMAVILTDRIKTELTSCRDIVATGRYPYTGRLGILRSEDEKIVSEALELVHAQDIAYRDFNNISDGQRQRILLARAICQKPELILLDEPTSYLDIKHKLELLSILTEMAREKNITVITSLHEIDLAEKVADRIITVKGREELAIGKIQEVFQEENIRSLYEIDNGFFDPLFGSIEMKKPKGDRAEIFVIAGGGRGIPIFRELQKKGIPFAAGIIHENDIDYRTAKMLAAELIVEKAFSPISRENLEKAKSMIDRCKKTVNTVQEFGAGNEGIRELIEYAQKEGKLWQSL